MHGSRRIAPGEWPEDSFDAQAPSGAAASQGAAASSGAAGRATSPSPLRVQIGTPRPDDERSLLEQLVAILQRQSPQREEGGKSSTLRLAKMPICGDHVLPSVKDWQQWYDVKFRSWAGAQAAGFAEAVDVFLKAGDVSGIAQYTKENKVLAYEICHMIDGRLLSYLMKVDKTNGALLLKTLNSVVTRGSAERTAALHNRFAAQSPCKTKEQLLHGLQVWKEDLEELQATGSAPGKETVMSSMKLLISGVRELKTVMEITELLALW